MRLKKVKQLRSTYERNKKKLALITELLEMVRVLKFSLEFEYGKGSSQKADKLIAKTERFLKPQNLQGAE